MHIFHMTAHRQFPGKTMCRKSSFGYSRKKKKNGNSKRDHIYRFPQMSHSNMLPQISKWHALIPFVVINFIYLIRKHPTCTPNMCTLSADNRENVFLQISHSKRFDV